jgi:hypothetical protein
MDLTFAQSKISMIKGKFHLTLTPLFKTDFTKDFIFYDLTQFPKKLDALNPIATMNIMGGMEGIDEE